jgi:hypothetical protein
MEDTDAKATHTMQILSLLWTQFWIKVAIRYAKKISKYCILRQMCGHGRKTKDNYKVQVPPEKQCEPKMGHYMLQNINFMIDNYTYNSLLNN